MPSHFTLRIQFGLHQDPKVVTGWLLDLVKAATADEIMLFYYGEELNNGYESIGEVKQWIEHSRRFRDALKKAGVIVSLNPWNTICGRPRGRVRKPGQDWQKMVGSNGVESSAIVCPMDKAWLAYINEIIGLYAAEDFRVIWIDDDIRFHGHGPELDWGGCFCPLHVAEFNRRAGQTGDRQATREQIIAACTQKGQPHPWRELWMDMWQDEHLKMITRWREIVEAGGSRLGLMSSPCRMHATEGRRWNDWWKAFGGGKPPIHRPHFWPYGETSAGGLSNCMSMLQQNRVVQPAKLECGPEIENIPYGQWNKSYRQTAAQMSVAHILGSTNLNISMYDFMGNDPADEPQRTAFLRAMRPVMDWLADEFPMSMKPVGVGMPWSQDISRKIHTAGSGKWDYLTASPTPWASWASAAGASITAQRSRTLNALSGLSIWGLDDDELRQMLAGGVLVDGPGADILIQRGFGELIGVAKGRFVPHEEMGYSIERCTDEAFALRKDADITVNYWNYSKRLFFMELAPGARAVSDICGPRLTRMAPGLVVFENALGGRVAIVPWNAQEVVAMNIQRAVQMRKTLAWLDKANTYGWVEGGAWLTPQFMADRKSKRGVVWNASPDAISEFAVHQPKGFKLSKATQVTTAGRRIKAKLKGGKVTLSEPMHQWEFVVFS